MFGILGALIKKDWLRLNGYFGGIKTAIETDNSALKRENIGNVILFMCGRLLGFLIPGIVFLLLGWWPFYWKAFFIVLVIGVYKAFRMGEGDQDTQDEGRKPDEVEIELVRQCGLEMQGAVINFMLRVISAVSPCTALIRPREERDIEVLNSIGEGFYMKDDIVIYQVEAEVEEELKGKITPEVEDTLQEILQRYAVKYVRDYPMLISPEAGGYAPIEILRAKGCGGRVLIDLVFTTEKSIPYIKDCRRARVERQKRQERTRHYIDEDYGE